jgi:hypothetical protein
MLVSSCPARPTKGLALTIFFLARSFADEHQLRLPAAAAERQVLAPRVERTSLAGEGGGFKFLPIVVGNQAGWHDLHRLGLGTGGCSIGCGWTIGLGLEGGG